jgi:DNA-binding CsgD family transcriptional regulator/PAS domain-containing protein
MSVNDDDLLRIVDSLYQAALEPSGWSRALDALTSALDGAGVIVFPLARPEAIIGSAELRDAMAVYAADWGERDSCARIARERGITRGLFTDLDLMTPDQIARDPFYQEFRRAFDLDNFAAFLSTPVPGSTLSVSAQRRLGRGPFEPRQLELLAKLGPHAARAFAMQERFGEVPSAVELELDALLNRFDCGAIAIARGGRVVAVNAAAEALLGDGLTIQNSRLVAAAHVQQARLELMLAKIFVRPLDGVGVIALARPSGARPLLLQAAPLMRATDARRFDQPPAHALALLFDLDKRGGVDPAESFAALGLTPAEVGVARLIGIGERPQAVADRLHISVETVRTHLKSINQKLGFGRQSDLVRLATRLGLLR